MIQDMPQVEVTDRPQAGQVSDRSPHGQAGGKYIQLEEILRRKL
jgi:hypothetical protein